MGVFRNLSNLISGQPLILRMELSPFGVRLMFLRGGTVISSAELLKVRSAPGVLVKYLSENVKASGNAFLVTLPVARQLSTGLTKHVSESFQLETEAVDSLVETSAPRDFHIHWRFEKTRQVLVRVLNGADGYLGSGWFYRGRSVWRITDAVPSKLTRWLSRAEIESHELYTFVLDVTQLNISNIVCDLTVEGYFLPRVHILKTLKRGIDVQFSSNRPELHKGLMEIGGDHANLISGTTLLPGWQPILGARLLHLARSGQTTRIEGDALPEFIKDDLLPYADKLQIDQQMLQSAYQILDAAALPLTLKLDYLLTQGVGTYFLAPYCLVADEAVPTPKIAGDYASGKRFVHYGSTWVEFTSRFKTRFAEWQNHKLGPILLSPREVMGSELKRLNRAHIPPPEILLPKENSERDQAQALIETMRLHGLPVGISGVQQDIADIVTDAVVKLLSEYQHSRILWIAPQRKRNDIVTTLARRRIRLTEPWGRLEGAVAVITPEYPHIQDTAWTLVIFSDLDTLASGDRQSQTLAALRRRWAIATFSDADWFRNNIRVERILYALQLDITDFPAFARHCMATFSNQQTDLPSRLTSPFKQIAIGSQPASRSTGSVPIPLRPSRPVPQPPPPPAETSKPKPTPSARSIKPRSLFLDQARQYVNRSAPAAVHIPFQQYWPTYESMTEAQQKWYFYWRWQVRQGHYLPTDLSYIFVHVYEIINLVGFEAAKPAFEHLVKLWQSYREQHPSLDGNLIDWLADLAVIHRVIEPLAWYAQAGKLGGRLTDRDLAVTAWLAHGQHLTAIPETVLEVISDYKPARSKFFQKHNENGTIEHALRSALKAIDDYQGAHTGKSLFDEYRPTSMRTVQRRAFAGAVYEGAQDVITIAVVPRWSEAAELRSAITSILKYSENLLRQQYGFGGRLRGIALRHEWTAVLDALIPPPAHAHSAEEMREARVVEAASPIVIDFEKAKKLQEESERVRELLTVAEEEGEVEDIDETSFSVEPTQAVHVQKRQFDTERPKGTPDHLLTELHEVAEVIREDGIAVALLKHLSTSSWEADAESVQSSLQGEFLNVVLDRVNEKAIDLLGDRLILLEGEALIVAEDYRDEVGHLLSLPDTKSGSLTVPSIGGLDDLTSEWAEFAICMQPNHWQALSALLAREDVSARLDSIARSAYTTVNLLIDEINDFALSSLGDIVIEPGSPPAIEEEDLDSLQSLMDWAVKHIVQEQ